MLAESRRLATRCVFNLEQPLLNIPTEHTMNPQTCNYKKRHCVKSCLVGGRDNFKLTTYQKGLYYTSTSCLGNATISTGSGRYSTS